MTDAFLYLAENIKQSLVGAKTMQELRDANARIDALIQEYSYLDDVHDGETPQMYTQAVDHLLQLFESKQSALERKDYKRRFID